MIFVANTNVLELLGLKSAIEDAFINDAAVSVTIKTKAGVAVSGETWPLAMAYVAASDGNYRAVLNAAIAFAAEQRYVAHIEVNAGAGRVGHWEFVLRPVARVD